MSKPTTTRATLRRDVGRMLGMEWFRRFNSYLACDSTSTTSKITDSTLTQPDDFWRGMWFYVSADTGSTGNIGNTRLIDHFSAADDALHLEYAVDGTPSSVTQYEIHNIWSTFELHAAINEAIRSGFPAFYDIVTDETLVHQEDTLEYSVNSLTYDPWIIYSVWIEQPAEIMQGTATAGAATSLTDTSADFSDVEAGWKLSIYDGTGKGQLKAVTSVTGTTQLNVATWTTNPDSTSKYAVWNPSEQTDVWYRVPAWHGDRDEHPSTLYLSGRYSRLYGSRIRLVYATEPLELTSESSTTIVPKDYVVNKAVALLAGSRVSSSRTDREKYALMEQQHEARAERIRNERAFRQPIDMTIESDVLASRSTPRDNPLDW